MSRLLSRCLLASALAWTAPALASPADAPAAEELFREGRAAFDRGDFAVARARFAESQRLDGAPGTLLNLAMAEEKLGSLSLAWEHAKSALDALPPGDERSVLARRLFEDLDKRVPRLRISLAEDAPAGVRVLRDGVELREGSRGVALPVDAGEHVVVVTAPGKAERRFTVTAREGATVALVVAEGLAADAPAPRAVAPAPTPVLGYAVGGAGILGLALGGVAGVMVLRKKNDVNAHCDAARACDDAAFDAASQGKTWSTVSTVSFVAGAALVGVGVVLVLSSRSSAEPAATAIVGPAGVAARFAF